MDKTRLNESKKGYNDWYTERGDEIFMEEIEYYKLIGSIIKGKKSIDIGCGFGGIEEFSPETVGVDFSEEAIEMGRKRGLKNLVVSPAETLPFDEDEFEVAVSIGVLEHVEDINKAISEMVRVSEIQICAIHAALPFGLENIRPTLLKILGYKDQPIEKPQTMRGIKKMFRDAGSRVLVEGVWNYIDLRWIHPKIPYGILKIPSHHFVMCIKTENLERRFIKDLEALKQS